MLSISLRVKRLKGPAEGYWGRYGEASQTSTGSLQHFKHLIDCVDAFLDLLAEPETDFRVKLMDTGRLGRMYLSFVNFM